MSSASATHRDPDDSGTALPRASNVSVLTPPAAPNESGDRDGGTHLPNSCVGASVNDSDRVDRDDGSIERMSLPPGAVVPANLPWQISGVDYDLTRGWITNRHTVASAVQVLENLTGDAQQMEVSFSESVTHTSNFGHSVGVSIAAGSKFTAGIPFVVTIESHIEITGSYTHTWGEETSTTRQWTARFPVNVGPWKTYRAISTVTGGTLQVPYTMRLWKPHDPAISGDTQGTWSGATSWDLRHVVTNEATGEVVVSF